MSDKEEPKLDPTNREVAMAARATIELFGNGAVAKTRERLLEVEEDGSQASVQYWRLLLDEVERLHERRQEY